MIVLLSPLPSWSLVSSAGLSCRRRSCCNIRTANSLSAICFCLSMTALGNEAIDICNLLEEIIELLFPPQLLQVLAPYSPWLNESPSLRPCETSVKISCSLPLLSLLMALKFFPLGFGWLRWCCCCSRCCRFFSLLSMKATFDVRNTSISSFCRWPPVFALCSLLLVVVDDDDLSLLLLFFSSLAISLLVLLSLSWLSALSSGGDAVINGEMSILAGEASFSFPSSPWVAIPSPFFRCFRFRSCLLDSEKV